MTKRQMRQKVGMVFQQLNWFPHMTALDNMGLAAKHAMFPAGFPRARAVSAAAR